MDFGYILTSTQGRIPRSQWWAGLVVLVIIGLVLGLLIGWVLGPTTIGVVAILILQIILLYPSYCISAKRFQDRNKPGGLALIGIGLAILQTLARLARPEQPLQSDRSRLDPQHRAHHRRPLVPDRARHSPRHHRPQHLRSRPARRAALRRRCGAARCRRLRERCDTITVTMSNHRPDSGGRPWKGFAVSSFARPRYSFSFSSSSSP